MRSLKTLLTVIGAVTVLVLAGNTVALAATGHSFILGKTNKANKVTTLKRTTAGAPLSLVATSSGAAPFTTNGKGKVTNLNADSVDGIDSSALKTRAYVFTRNVSVATTSVVITVPLPAGKYVVSYSAYMSGAESATIDCYLEQNPLTGSSTYSAESRFTAGTGTPGATGTGFIDQSVAGTTTLLHCSSPNAWTTFGDEPIQIVATKVDTASGPTAARLGSARMAH